MTKDKQALGRWGESQAAEFLIQNGYKIQERNFRTSYGEIDLIAAKNDIVVFVEVKTRTTDTYGHPEQSITPKKRKAIIRSSQAYLQYHPEIDTDWRIDVIAIQHLYDEKTKIIHFENAITE